jgi:hypothetical protein
LLAAASGWIRPHWRSSLGRAGKQNPSDHYPKENLMNFVCCHARQLLTLTMIVAAIAIPVSTVANAADSDTCIFIKKVIADNKNEFSSFKGNEDTSLGDNHIMFTGILVPSSGISCNLYVRRKLTAKDRSTLPPSYSCTLAKEITFDDGEVRYAGVVDEIKMCLPAWKFSEEKSGGRTDRDEAWEFVAVKPGIKVSTGFSDVGELANLLSRTNSSAPGVVLTLDFEITAAGRRGANLPIMNK